MSIRVRGRLITDFMASSGHRNSQLRQYRHFRPHNGRPWSSSTMFSVGQMSMHFPHAVHLSESTLNERLYKFSTSHRLLKQVALEHVFSHKEVEKLELQGYRIINGLLECYKPLLQLTSDDFKRALHGDNRLLIESRLVKKLSKKHLSSYQHAINAMQEEPDHFAAYEFYYRCRLIQDYISGMTDQFAYDEYRSLMVID